MGWWKRRTERRDGGVVSEREFLKENGISNCTLWSIVSFGIITGICLKSSVQGYALTSDLYESTSPEGTFPPATFKSYFV